MFSILPPFSLAVKNISEFFKFFRNPFQVPFKVFSISVSNSEQSPSKLRKYDAKFQFYTLTLVSRYTSHLFKSQKFTLFCSKTINSLNLFLKSSIASEFFLVIM